MHGLQIWPIDALFNSRKWSKWAGKWQILSDSVRRGGERGVNFGHAKSAGKKKFLCVCEYVIDFSVRQLSNKKLSNKTTYIHPYIHTYRHHSDQISRSAWTARLKMERIHDWEADNPHHKQRYRWPVGSIIHIYNTFTTHHKSPKTWEQRQSNRSYCEQTYIWWQVWRPEQVHQHNGGLQQSLVWGAPNEVHSYHNP